ncbi:MAG TPA: SIMPL domain-containing protein [Solirubrobacterales bacterium]|nr:SIMPL domain-containing protein [Solirubrobacterales bacterium]
MGQVRRLVFPLVVFAALLAPAAATAAERTVSVQATVERQVPNDAARVHFTVSKERQGRAAALRIVAQRLRAVIVAAQSTPGVGPGDITTGSISVRRVKRGKRPVYRASESVTVITHDPNAAGDLVAAGVAAGATSTGGPIFFVGNRETAYNAALVEAFAQAKTKAEILAAAAGATLGPAITIAESGSVETLSAPQAKDSPSTTEAAPSPPTKPGRSTVTATVAATFALQ